MNVGQVPAALHARLGDEATAGLLEVLDRSHREAREDLISGCTERFERRLVEEASGLRVQIAQLGGELRQEIAATRADLRQEIARAEADVRREMATMGADLRQEIATLGADLRQEMAAMGGALPQDMAAGRVELFKWCFLLWVGQVLAISGVVGVMFRVMR